MANVKFTFSSNMEHPDAGDDEGSETWTAAPGFIKAELHWLLGHTPDNIECYFHAADQRQFPWTRVRAYDENGVIGIWRFDTIEEQFEATQRVWKATGRCVLYGAVDNFMRSPRIKADQAVTEDDPDLDDDPNYTEWPIIPPKVLVTYEDLQYRFDSKHFRVTSCGALIDETGCGGPNSPCNEGLLPEEEDCESGEHTHGNFPYCHEQSITHGYDSQEAAYSGRGEPCVYDRNTDRDEFLLNNFAENRYNIEQSKLGPNYVWKGVRRGWVFKDILRHSSGTHDAASRPILGVYNRTALEEQEDPIAGEGEPIRSNFQQSQQAGAGASALASDVAISWPWIGYETGDSGYDYRTVWPGKTDRYSPSGQAVELFRRGSQEWDDSQCIGGGADGISTETRLDVVKIVVSGTWVYTGLHAMVHSFALGTCDIDGFIRHNLPGAAIRSAEQTHYDVDGIPAPPAACALLPSAPPLYTGPPVGSPPCSSAYVVQTCFQGGVKVHDDCHIKVADTVTLKDMSITIYIGELSSLNCAGDGPDYYQDAIGFGTCPGGCGDDEIVYSILIPNSCCFWDNDTDGVDCATTEAELLANPALCDNLKKEVPIGDGCVPNTPAIGFEVSVGAKDIYSRARASGMGMNNPGGEYTALLPGCETTWNPDENKFLVRRELLVNDYGINEGEELHTLAKAYLVPPDKELGGFTTLKIWLGGIPRAGATAPHPNRIVQAGDRLNIAEGFPNVDAGLWVVDEAHYSFPKGISTFLLSKRPAAQAVRTRGSSGNVRNLGETIANEFGVWESPWFNVWSSDYLLNPAVADPSKYYSTFKLEHYMGVIPRTYLVLAAKTKIYDWYDDEKVTSAQPLYVPQQFLDLSQVQGVGYNVVAVDEIQVVFHFWRYLFYDGIDGKWVLPEERQLKIWLIA